MLITKTRKVRRLQWVLKSKQESEKKSDKDK